MTRLEIELRELLIKYGMDIYAIHMIIGHNNKNILEIVFEELGDENGKDIRQSIRC